MAKTWSEAIDNTAKKFELAAMFKCSCRSDTAHCDWLAATLREMARILDRDARERARILGGFRLFGLRVTISRNEAGK
ncbi:hypothetical protein A1D31_14155 [Bradyrhizobium liaoningense]|nr:hypothetical protein A1D31_14155 [Bradyrhizobium liaoningense]